MNVCATAKGVAIRNNINTSKFEEVLNLSDKLKLKSDDEASINIMDFYIKEDHSPSGEG